MPDQFLINSLRGHDSAALYKLMDRYDRLVRYVIFKTARHVCTRDPDFLESVAGDVWTNFVSNAKGDTGLELESAAAYLSTLAQRRTVSALRQLAAKSRLATVEIPSNIGDSEEVSIDEQLMGLEAIEALKSCYETLSGEGQQMLGQLPLLMQRKWNLAANALGWSESTLRSRWSVTLEKLRDCVEGKSGIEIAPGVEKSDS